MFKLRFLAQTCDKLLPQAKDTCLDRDGRKQSSKDLLACWFPTAPIPEWAVSSILGQWRGDHDARVLSECLLSGTGVRAGVVERRTWWGYVHLLCLLRGLAEWSLDTVKDTVDLDVGPTVVAWSCVRESWLLPFTKGMLPRPFAHMLGCDLTAIPDLLSGPIDDQYELHHWGPSPIWPFLAGWKGMVKSRIHSRSDPDAVADAYSLIMVKKACFKLPESAIEQTMEDHLAALAKIPRSWGEIEDRYDKASVSGRPYELYQDRLNQKLRRLWTGVNPQPLAVSSSGVKIYPPSTGACLEFKRVGGGQQGYLQYLAGPQKTPAEIEGRHIGPTDRLTTKGRGLSEPLFSMIEVSPGKVLEVRGGAERPSVIASKFLMPAASNQPEIATHESGHDERGADPLESMDLLLDLTKGNDPHTGPFGVGLEIPLPGVWTPSPGGWYEYDLLTAVVAPVLEPLKCRLVSKGNGGPYWLAKGLQKTMQQHLARLPVTRLTGRVVEPGDIDELAFRGAKLCPVDRLTTQFWVSGDYKAATDNLNLNVTKLAFEVVVDCVKRNLRRRHCSLGMDGPHAKRYWNLMRRVLYEHNLRYPGVFFDNGEERKGVQHTGQLMGSPLSFPILCSVNLCTYWLALEDCLGRSVMLEDLAVLVNGDDILFPAWWELYQWWDFHRSQMSFLLSQGKNYTSPLYAVINSQLFHCPLRPPGFSNRVLLGPEGLKEAEGLPDHPAPMKRFTRLYAGGMRVPWWQLDDPEIDTALRITTPIAKAYPVVNWGHLVGFSKLQNNSTLTANPLEAAWKDSVLNAKDPVRMEGRFMHFHLREVRLWTDNGRYNLFFESRYGGLGLTPYLGLDVAQRSTRGQIALAEYLRRQYKKAHAEVPDITRYHCVGSDMSSLRHETIRSWKRWEFRAVGPLLPSDVLDGDPIVWCPEYGLLSSKTALRVGAPLIVRPSRKVLTAAREVLNSLEGRTGHKVRPDRFCPPCSWRLVASDSPEGTVPVGSFEVLDWTGTVRPSGWQDPVKSDGHLANDLSTGQLREMVFGEHGKGPTDTTSSSQCSGQ